MAILTTLALGSVALQGVSLIGGAAADKKAAKENQRIGLLDATLAEAAGVSDERTMRRNQIKQIGNMRAAFGASGVALEGSPLDALADSAATAALDVLTLKFNTRLKVAGARLGASRDAGAASSAGVKQILGAASTALGFAKVAATAK